MNGCVRAEWLKLSRRPAIWILGVILASAVFTLGYLLAWVGAVIIERTASTPSMPDPAATAELLRSGLEPVNFLGPTLQLFSSIGGAIAIILGALTIGSEYGWGTFKTIFTQGPNRLTVLAGKALGLAGILLVFTLVALIAGLAGSIFLALIDGTPIGLPAPARLLGGVGAGWLILANWTALGLVLATLFRSTPLAIGLGLVYVLIIESVIGGITILIEPLKGVRQVFLGANSSDLANAFAAPPPSGFPLPDRIPTLQTALVLVLYSTIFLGVTAFLMQRRDVE